MDLLTLLACCEIFVQNLAHMGLVPGLWHRLGHPIPKGKRKKGEEENEKKQALHPTDPSPVTAAMMHYLVYVCHRRDDGGDPAPEASGVQKGPPYVFLRSKESLHLYSAPLRLPRPLTELLYLVTDLVITK